MVYFHDEILLHIFDYFNAVTLSKISFVCKHWLDVSKTSRLWRGLVLRRWPSQRFLYKNVPVTCVKWSKVYQDLFLKSKYSPDDMKYFISCRVGEDELYVDELREAMLLHMSKVVLKWTEAEPFEVEENGSFPHFNGNFDFYYDTHDFKWKFIDKRQEYIEELMGHKLSAKLLRKPRFIRPYQVMPSCVGLYRWMTLFRPILSDEQGLTFYRIWRHHLKHRETGLLLEVCDWKAAMSCSLLKGKPAPGPYMDDCLELMDLLSNPNFIMHSVGLQRAVIRKTSPFSPSSGMSRQTSVSSIISNAPKSLSGSNVTLDNNSTEKLSEGRVACLWGVSGTESDDESEYVYDDSGYSTNCEYFISTSHWDVDEQQAIQSSVAALWSFGQAAGDPQMYLSYDSTDETWYFYAYSSSNGKKLSNEDRNGPSNNLLPLEENKSKQILEDTSFHGLSIEPIPSCLALYRLICLFDLNVHNYKDLSNATIWSVSVIHNQTGAGLTLKDMNGWLEVSVTLSEELMNELQTSQQCSAINNSQDSIEDLPLAEELVTDNMQLPVPWNDEYDGDDDNDYDPDDATYDGDDDRSSFVSDVALGDQHLEELDPLDAFHPDVVINNYDNEFPYQADALNDTRQTNLDLFKSDVVTILDLLISEKFGHPYGTIAGCVA